LSVVIVNLAATSVAYEKIYHIDEWDYYFGTDDDIGYSHPYEDALDMADNIVIKAQGLTSLIRMAMSVFLIIGIITLFIGRKSYGKKHSQNAISALILGITSLFLMFFYFATLQYDGPRDYLYHPFLLIPVASFILFLGAVYLAINKIGGRIVGTAGILFGLASGIPFLFLDYSFFEEGREYFFINFELIRYCEVMIVVDLCLIVAMIFLLVAIRRALNYTKTFPASPDEPHEPTKDEFKKLFPKRRGKGKKKGSLKKKLVVVGVIAILILAPLGVYWFFIRIPDLKEFMQGSYSDGEKVKFRAKVYEVEVIETSYGTVTQVTFENFHFPFCFIGDRTNKYQIGKTVITEVEFHEYNIDGVEIVLLKELVLGFYLIMEELLLKTSGSFGIGLQVEIPENNPDLFDLKINTQNHAGRTFSLDYYETSLNHVPVSMDENEAEYYYSPFGYLPGMDFVKPGTLIYDFLYLEEDEYNYLNTIYSEINCTSQKDDEGYLPDRTTFNDVDNDGNLSIGDIFQIDIKPTKNEKSFNTYRFCIGGITSGMAPVLNWYNGPFYSIDRYTFYSWSPLEESYSDDTYTHKLSVHNVIGKAYSLSNISLTLYDYNYNRQEIPFVEIIDGERASVENIAKNVTLLFHDSNQLEILDSGDYFLIEELDNKTIYSMLLKDESENLFHYRKYIVSNGESFGNYPLLTMGDPYRKDDKISFIVLKMDVDFPRFDDIVFILEIPDKNIHISTGLEYSSVMEAFRPDLNITLAVKDNDDNSHFTKNDTVEIQGLKKGTEYSLKIIRRDDFLLYEMDAVA